MLKSDINGSKLYYEYISHTCFDQDITVFNYYLQVDFYFICIRLTQMISTEIWIRAAFYETNFSTTVNLLEYQIAIIKVDC